ncbi:hypothetical protein [Pilimelia columellifera]
MRAAVTRVLDAIEDDYGAVIDVAALGGGLYRDLPLDAAYEPAPPTGRQLTCGDVLDDAASVSDLTVTGREITLWHDAHHLAGLLRFIANLDVPSEAPSATRQAP